ncbi:CAAX amino terminal protease family protein [Roseovarius sp. EC-HK134]|uniref:exosortase E/protease, VPEID-CTERM system n=1 Tax=unclassified Roseovarius TaxID=2614913 RepID=UPI0012565A6B|nr:MULTISPECIES: exosortase E/protease, VPEID-CTERM system [unclassified Roseovarius]VVT32336.1 CAAX amino terminal protease family protein [Roseovarius sp. EC-HK134]VVT32608.1 CAAX amino terminal protease family protein [Roseovarius sp. EC-SD190]
MSEDTGKLIPHGRALSLGGLFVAEMVVLVLGYQVLSDLECRATGIEAACRGLRFVALWLLCAGSLVGIYLWARPVARADFGMAASRAPGGLRWAVIHGLGILAMLAPLIVIAPEALSAEFQSVFPLAALGALMAALGGLLWLMRPAAWLSWLQGRSLSLLAMVVFAAALPGAVVLAGPLWSVQAVTDVTFIAVFLLLRLFVEEVVVDPATYVIGTPEFQVMVADSCSGIEGLVLITAFLALYGVLFRDELRLRRFGLVIWPLALLVSWLFNAVRITGLILIGVHVSPELAVNGFHSFAGWLMFTALSIGVLVVVGRSGYALQAVVVPQVRSVAPLAQDDVAGRILPFIVFALSGLIAQAFWSEPALAYPVQAGMMLAALWWVRATLWQHLAWPSMLSVVAGIAVGVVWIATAPASEPPSDALMSLGAGAFALWASVRILGTVALVPVIEELFFRGYVQARLDRGTVSSQIIAIGVSAGLFALVHGRWIEAGLAGVVFSLVYMRNGRLADAMAAHAVANAVIAAVALWRGDWALI